MKWIGLTGGIATGKSSVAEILKNSGYPVANADVFVHEGLAPGGAVVDAVIKAFGQEMAAPAGGIDRKKLATQVFHDETARLLLESIVHPYVKQRAQLEKEKYKKQGAALGFYDVPLLFEKKLQGDFDKVIVVWCNPDLQLRRLMERSGLSQEEASARIAVQRPLEEKKQKADYLIENNSTAEVLKANTMAVLKKLESLK